MLQLLGHLHPVLVHLPIGILLLACLLLWQSRKDPFVHLQPAINTTMFVGAASAVVACVTGFILSETGDYVESTVTLHQWMGISVAVVSVLAYVVSKIEFLRRWQMPLTFLLFPLIFITGHLGGSLTHGSDYLTKPLEDLLNGDTTNTSPRKLIPDIQEAYAYADVIKPILQTKCGGCHGRSRQKGRLRLDDSANILKGGKDGPVIISAKAAESELVKRIMLPVEDEHHMSPKDKPQLTEQETALLKWWINEGVSFSKKVNQLPQPEPIKPVLLNLQGDDGAGKTNQDVPRVPAHKASASNLQALTDSGVLVVPVAQNSNYLYVNFINVVATDHTLTLLLPLREQLIWLRLSNQSVTDASIPTIIKCVRLTKLDLDHTLITDKGLKYLGQLKGLRSLNLVGTHITLEGLKQLQGLKDLRYLYLYQTNLNQQDSAFLKTIFLKAVLDFGGYQVPLLPDDTVIVKPPPTKE